ncbi:MAG: stage III sporulation protein AB [Lachnospiraceae bacterium]|nr:stage III sporulation protein AB [Lachnospiraceae bacterium]MDE6185838.1 stage III sporulation protein AB [Lachnospiraceae bacterium]
MLRVAGCILAVIGCAGFAGNICIEAAKRLLLLKKIKSIYETMKYYISYQKATIPETLRKLAEKENEPFAAAFAQIDERVCVKGENLPSAWKNCMGKVLEELPLTKAERRLIMDFPNSLGFMEENAQAGALDELLREINLHIEEIEKEHKSKNKMIMSLGVAAGVLISILLL